MRRHTTITLLGTIVGLLLALFNLRPDQQPIPVASAAVPLPAGYADFTYPSAGNTPTGEKPQSKLWYNDGRWWADMLAADGLHYIYYLDLATQNWIKTTTMLDIRTKTKSDCLWDGTHLYVATGGGSVATGSDLDGVLYRYSYNPNTQAYTKDFGPVTIRTGGAEALVLDKDSTGKLWITYTQGNKVWINRSTGADNLWNPAAAFNPPSAPSDTGSALVDPDDISSLVAYDGKIGVLWSRHSTSVVTDNSAAFYFASRDDSAADMIGAWQTKNLYSGPNYSDDHLNIKSLQAAGKEVYAVVKTSIRGTSNATPQILLLGRRADGSWIQPAMISSSAETLTRPVLLIDPEHRKLHVFMSTEGGGNVYYKQSSMDNISFPTGLGTQFIQSGSGLVQINNATSTKQTVSSASGIVILASDDSVKWYAHNYMNLGSPTPRVVFDNILFGAPAGAPLAVQPVVRVQDQSGNTDTSYNGTVTVVIKSGTGTAGAGLKGTATVNAINGVARFSSLSVSKAGTGYRLTASAPGRSSNDSNLFDITKGSQTITFIAPANVTYGDPPINLGVSTSSGLSVALSASGPCTVSGTSLTLTNVGTCSVTASQAGDASYYPAANVTRSFTIGKRNQTIAFGTLANKIYGNPPFNLTASASSGLAVSFSSAGVCTVLNGVVSLSGIGSCTITASQFGNASFNAAPQVARTFSVTERSFTSYIPITRVP
jgi:hypothetical protein